MKLHELTDAQKEKVFGYDPEWCFENYPEWCFANHPEWWFHKNPEWVKKYHLDTHKDLSEIEVSDYIMKILNEE